jgi:hypothetical protein
MDSVTVKSSTIFISIGKRTKIYRSVDDVPPRLRKRLEQSTSGMNSATILIADRGGREELVRSIQGLPSCVQTRVGADRPRRAVSIGPVRVWKDYRHWIAIGGVGLFGLGIWLAFLR